MNWPSFLLISLLLTGSLCLDVQPRQPNMVSRLLKKVLDQTSEKLSQANVSLADIEMTEAGRIYNLKLGILGGMTSEIDGYGPWGFSLKLEMKDLVLGAQYDIKHLELPNLFPIYGKGDLEVAVEWINLNIVFEASSRVDSEKFDIKIPAFNVSAGTSKVRFESLMDNPAVTEFLNELISDLVPDLVTTLNGTIWKTIDLLSDYYGNGIIHCVRTQILTAKKCIKDFLSKKDKLPTRLAAILAEVVRENFLKYNFTK